MKNSAVTLVIVMTLLVMTATSQTATALRVAPWFTLDLSKAPSKRWEGAVDTILSHHSWETSFGPLFEHYQHNLFSKLPVGAVSSVRAAVSKNYPETMEELVGLASQFAAAGHPEIDVTYLQLGVYFHSLDHWWPSDDHNANTTTATKAKSPSSRTPYGKACTGILTLPSDPTASILHFRNLDQSVSSGRNVTLNIKVVRGTKLLYQASDFYWWTSGFVTVFKSGGITLEENWRYEHPKLSLAQIISRIEQGALSQVLMFRSFLAAHESTPGPLLFDAMITYLNTSLFASPFYGIVSGTHRRGAVLTIDYNASKNVVVFLNDQTFNSDGVWFLVQTNYDRSLPDPPSDPRRTVAENTLRDLGQEEGATKLGGWQTLSVFPVHNVETFYSLAMEVMDNATRAYIRQAMVPVY